MRTRVGCFEQSVEVGAASGDRFIELKGWVDTGAYLSQFPAALLKELGHEPNDVMTFRLADGRTSESPIGSVPMRLAGRPQQSVLCVFGESDDVLIGALTLETFRLAVDPLNQRLLPIAEALPRLTRLPADDLT